MAICKEVSEIEEAIKNMKDAPKNDSDDKPASIDTSIAGNEYDRDDPSDT